MSTTGIESWALDLKDVTAIYPFQGVEWLLVIIGLVCWIGWHVWCVKWESNYHNSTVGSSDSPLGRLKALAESHEIP